VPRFNRPREFYVPKGARRFADRKSSAVVYAYERDLPGGALGLFLIGFHGKANKPDFHYRYSDPAKREERANLHFQQQQAAEARIRERREERKAFQHDHKVGDVFRSSWGYDQTNVNFYQCVALRGKSQLVLREIGAEREDAGCWEQYKVVPRLGQFIGEEIVRKAARDGVMIDRVEWARKMEPIAMIGNQPVFEASHETKYA
jgi:hypothetical protein